MIGFSVKATEKIRTEHKNVFPTFFSNLSGKLIPRVYQLISVRKFPPCCRPEHNKGGIFLKVANFKNLKIGSSSKSPKTRFLSVSEHVVSKVFSS